MPKRPLVGRITKQYRSRVRQARLAALVPTQRELARMSGINRTTISALENNRLFLSAPYALAIAEALGCTLDDLYEKRAAKRERRRHTALAEAGDTDA